MKSAASTVKVSLRRCLHEHLARIDYQRDLWLLHASELTRESPEFCPREAILRKRTKAPPVPQKISCSLAVTFDWGRTVELRVRDWFAEMGRAVGDWRCAYKRCRKVYPWQVRPIVCSECENDRFDYIERRAYSSESGIGAGLDLFANMDENRLRLVEIKSIDKDEFKQLSAPLAEHRLRTNLYLRAMAESGNPEFLNRVNLEKSTVLYVSKGGYGCLAPDMALWQNPDGKFSPFKEYEVTRDDALTQPVVEKALQVQSALMGGPVPGRICGVETCKRAQACSMRQNCFYGDF